MTKSENFNYISNFLNVDKKKLFVKIILAFSLTSSASSQNCELRNLTSYSDTLNVIEEYTFHLLENASLNLKHKLTSLYTGNLLNNNKDTCYLFLIPNSEQEVSGDGDFVSLFLHKATIENQKDVLWIEVVRLNKKRNFYLLSLTTNRIVDGKKRILKKLNYKVKCKKNDRHFSFRRRLF
jgi:hypothetical protein